jgi:hypothetical protein
MSAKQSDVLTWLKTWVTNKFPAKKKKQIEDWDFIMVFEKRYLFEIDKYFETYVTKNETEGNKYQLLDN